MKTTPRILIVIPARGGSKGVPRKNLSPLAGKPLLSYAVRTSLSASCGARVVVSTDSEEIASIARREGVDVIMRDPALSSDAITLDPVIFHAVQFEESQGRSYDFILTVQTTSPLLRPATIVRIIARLAANEADTIVTAVNDTHLAWKMRNGTLVPEHEKRLNRQLLPRRFRETGGVIAVHRRWISPNSRFGPRVALEIIDEIEGLDLDTPEDWLFAEAALDRRRVAFITIGDETNGLGHVMRVRNLLECLHGHPTLVLCDPTQKLAINLLRDSFLNVEVCDRNKMLERIVQWGAQIVVHDELETDPRQIAAERNAGLRIVLFEDDGPSKESAHLVFNALFGSHGSQPERGWWFGPEVYDLREEFRHAERAGFREKPRRILITFGGTDPSGLTGRILDEIIDICPYPITVVAGIGMRHYTSLADKIAEMRVAGHQIDLLRHVPMMSDVIRGVDIAFSSAGRTLYELAHMAVPTIVVRQNLREAQHEFGSLKNGFLDLGICDQVSSNEIRSAFLSLRDSVSLRRALHEGMLSLDLTTGRDRVVRMILDL